MAGSHFRVVIVGGGIAGLTLANMLERFDIDYVLLEGRDDIAPPEGASIGIVPGGLLILDQLGCYEAAKEASLYGEIHHGHHRDADGRPRTHDEDIYAHLEKRSGYPFLFLPRQWLLRILYNRLQQKHKVRLQSRVTEIHNVDTGVQVKTVDGRGYVGDVVVGADGIYSVIRREMRRLAEETRPGYFHPAEEETVSCHYLCLFGISMHVPGWVESDMNFVHGYGNAFLTASGVGGRCYWFLFSKLPEPKYGKDIPRYTKEDEELFVKEHAHLPITEKFTLGDAYSKRVRSGMTALPVKVFKKWCFDRMVLIGDSAHKPNPSTGRGATAAIESAAAFINVLLDARDSRPGGLDGLSAQDIESVSREMQAIREEQATTLIDGSVSFQALLSKEKPVISNFVLRVVMPFFGGEATAVRLSEPSLGVQHVKRLPVPRRPRVVPFNFELPASPMSSWLVSNVRRAFIGGMAFALTMGASERPSTPINGISMIYRLQQLVPLLLICTVEGYRAGQQRSVLALPVLFTVSTQVFGIGNIIPVYGILHALFCAKRPDSRFVQPEVARALGPALVLTCGLTALKHNATSTGTGSLVQNEALWKAIPLVFSSCTALLASYLRWRVRGQRTKRHKPRDGKENGPPPGRKQEDFERYYDPDVPVLNSVYSYAFAAQAAVHFAQLAVPWIRQEVPVTQVLFWGSPQAALIGHNLFCIWDLRQQGYVTTWRALRAALGVTVGQVVVGSWATWTGLWRWRENVISGLSKIH